MPLRPITPHAAVEQLIVGEFRQGPDYTNWRPRGTSDWLLIHTLAGSGRIVAGDGQEWNTAPGEIVLYEPHAYQDYGTASGRDGGAWRLRWSHFHPRACWLPWLRWPARARGLHWLRLEPGTLRRRVEAALAEALRWHGRREFPGHVDLAANALERALLWARATGAGGAGWARVDERVRRAVEWLGEEWREPFSLPLLAARCGLSVSRLAHLFKAQVGVSPQQFAERRRLERACQLLRYTGLSVGEIAAEIGFERAFYFSKRFRRHLGHSPSEFRARAGGSRKDRA